MSLSKWDIGMQSGILLLKLMLLFYLYRSVGFIRAWLIFYVYLKVVDYISRKYFHVQRVEANDGIFIGREKNERYNIMAILKMKNFDENRLKEFLIEKLVRVFPKFRCILEEKFYTYFWREYPLYQAEEKVRKSKTVHIFDEQDLMKYISIELNTQIDIFRTFPYEFHFLKFFDTHGEGCLVIKFDHCFTDGMGVVSLIGSMADNYSQDLYPSIMKKNGLPSVKKIVKDLFTFPFTYFKHKRFQMVNNVINLKNMEPSGESHLKFSKAYDFDKLFNICKKLQISFNEFLIANISAGLKAYFKKNHPTEVPKSIALSIPVATRGIPKAKENITVNNSASMVFVHMPLIDDPIKQYPLVKSCLHESVGNTFNHIFNKLLLLIGYEIFPMFILNKISKLLSSRVDICISNVPGSKIPLFYSGSEIHDILSVINSGKVFAFSLVLTYNNKLRILFSLDKLLGMKPEDVIEHIESTFDKSIDYLEKVEQCK